MRMCEPEEEGKVKQGHWKGRGTRDGETEEEIEGGKKRKNKRWKRGWKDVGWGVGREDGGGGESKKKKKKKQEAIYVSLDGGTAPTPCHVLAQFTALTVR